MSCQKDQIDKSFNDMINQTSKENNLLRFSDIDKKSYLNSLKVFLEKGEFSKFQFGGNYY